MVVYKKTDQWYIKWPRVTTDGTTIVNKWYNGWQWVTKSNNKWQRVTGSDNEWQKVTTSDNEWHPVIQGMATSGTISNSKWERETTKDPRWIKSESTVCFQKIQNSLCNEDFMSF